jgi:hypothetical protein
MSQRRFAILIANSQFPSEPRLHELRNPENDVDGLNSVLSAQELGGFTDIALVKNASSYDTKLEINKVLKRAQPDDLVMIYYSGHGKLDGTYSRLYLTSKDTQIDTLEVTAIPLEWIHDFVRGRLLQRVVFILDCCFSGAAGNVLARGGVEEQLQMASRGGGIYILTASTENQTAQERESDQYGLFTKHVIEGIRTGAADMNQDGNISIDDLYDYVKERMATEGLQIPTLSNSKVQGDIFISSVPKARRDALYRLIAERAPDLPQEVLARAFDVIRHPEAEAPESLRRYNKLLDQLQKKQIAIGEFVGKWYEELRMEEEAKRRAEQEARLKQALLEQEEQQRRQEEKRMQQEQLRLQQQAEDQRKQAALKQEQQRKLEEQGKQQEQLRLRQQAEEQQRKQAALKQQPAASSPAPAPQQTRLVARLDAAFDRIERYLSESSMFGDASNRRKGWELAGQAFRVIAIGFLIYSPLISSHNATIDLAARIVFSIAGLVFLFGVLRGIFGF